jgi:hypothetical protein
MKRGYRLRRQGTGRIRLDGTPSGAGGWVVTMPDPVVRLACIDCSCDPTQLRFSIGWDPRSGEIIYLPRCQP